MKKRSMLAIASLATGFVVAALTPSHALGEDLGGLGTDDTLGALDGAVDTDTVPDLGAVPDLGEGQKGRG